MMIKTCTQCGKSFTASYRTQKLCSKQCASMSMSRKVELTCPICNKVVKVHKGIKFCSRKCADSARRGVRLSLVVIKICPVCGNSFESKYSSQTFCCRDCGNKGRKPRQSLILSEEEKQRRSNHLKKQWTNEAFRNSVVDRMRLHNPVYMPGVVEKANITRSKTIMHNNFKYGNGKISPHESLAKSKLEPLGFIYNYAIVTRDARAAEPDANYAHAYKPDFVNLDSKLCIEIDGYGHSSVKEKIIDAKKERCLNLLGYTVIRFTHSDIDKGEFDRWLNSYQRNM